MQILLFMDTAVHLDIAGRAQACTFLYTLGTHLQLFI